MSGQKSQAGVSADTRWMANDGFLHLSPPLYRVQSWLPGTPRKRSFTESVLSISTAFCFKQNIKKGQKDIGKHLLLECRSFAVTMRAYNKRFPIKNAYLHPQMYSSELAWFRLTLLGKSSVLSKLQRRSLHICLTNVPCMVTETRRTTKKLTTKTNLLSGVVSGVLSFLLTQQGSEHINISIQFIHFKNSWLGFKELSWDQSNLFRNIEK